MPKINKNVFVAMSGGVDSSVAALLLKRQGYKVIGVYMKNWSDPFSGICPWKKDLKDFHIICKTIRIPSRVEIFEDEYRKKIVSYLLNGYKNGITPNPDMLCNREIKFGVFLDKMRKLGANYIATGHYVQKITELHGKDERNILKKAKDLNKDQSYFLALLNQQQLRYSLFPVGMYKKEYIRSIARRAGLHVHNKKDSQGICFIGNIKFKQFINEHIKSKPGKIISTSGKIIGVHQGLMQYTCGQRHGIGIGGGIPYYIVQKNHRKNELIVAHGLRHKSLYSKTTQVSHANWIAGNEPIFPLKCSVKIRYRQPAQACIVHKIGNFLCVNFKHSQRAITPGQFAVFYLRNVLLGGGVIT
ncbi:MAG: tRNA 2-thiouridine(34) synthase MnmA [Patescibacteria group bacterium]